MTIIAVMKDRRLILTLILPENVVCFLHPLHICKFTPDKENNMSPDQTAPTKEQSDQDSYCLEYTCTRQGQKSCKHMHLSFKSVCNKEHKGVLCNMISYSNSFQSTWKNYSSFLDFIRN